MKTIKILKTITMLVILILILQLLVPIKIVVAVENITSTKYQIKNNIIMIVQTGTTVSQFLNNIIVTSDSSINNQQNIDLLEGYLLHDSEYFSMQYKSDCFIDKIVRSSW